MYYLNTKIKICVHISGNIMFATKLTKHHPRFRIKFVVLFFIFNYYHFSTYYRVTCITYAGKINCKVCARIAVGSRTKYVFFRYSDILLCLPEEDARRRSFRSVIRPFPPNAITKRVFLQIRTPNRPVTNFFRIKKNYVSQ